jgi:purine-binding chemotaxis protein CheW
MTTAIQEKETEMSQVIETAKRSGGQLVVFALGADEYALPINKVQEIIRYSEPRAVSADEPWIAGVISLRGKIIPVCDLALRLGQPGHALEDAKIVIVDAAAGTAGIIVDDVAEVMTVDAGQLDPVPAAGNDFMESIAKLGDRLVVVLDPEELFGQLELAA